MNITKSVIPILAFSLVILNVFQDIPAAQASKFADLQGHWSQEYVQQLDEIMPLNGYVENGQTVYRPDAQITKAEAYKIMTEVLVPHILPYISEDTLFSYPTDGKWADRYLGYFRYQDCETQWSYAYDNNPPNRDCDPVGTPYEFEIEEKRGENIYDTPISR
ncbi:MAG: hypothetical protein U9Q15_04695 [Patescibacteria group bacterium]|nr:hypothetical protein [Patescibacteria group bacterium]